MLHIEKLIPSHLKKLLTGNVFFVFAMMTANIMNLVFNAYLGRVISLADFALVTFINTIFYIINIVLAALSATIVRKIAFTNAQKGPKAATYEFRKLQKNVLGSAIVLTFIFILFSPVFTHVFQLSTVNTMLYLSPAIVALAVGIVHRAYLQARLQFFLVGLVFITEPVVKLITAVVIINSGFPDQVYLSIPVAGIVASSVVVFIFIRLTSQYKADTADFNYKVNFPVSFFSAALITGMANNLFLTFDVLLVKRFFPAEQAGIYSLLSLVGKMIFFFGSVLISFMIPYVSANLGANKNPARIFNIIFALTLAIVTVSILTFSLSGEFFLPLIFGEKAQHILPYITFYSVSIGAYTVSSAILMYHLARKHYSFSAVAFFFSLLLCAGIMLFHSSLNEVVGVILYLSMMNLVVLYSLHVIHSHGVVISRTIVDFACIFLPVPVRKPGKKNGKKILIFNWRDTRHSFSGGAEVYIHELAKRWVAKGNSVTLFCGNDQKSPRYETMEGVDVIRRGGFYMVYIWAFLYYIVHLRGRYDIILDCENGIPFFTPLFVKEKVLCVLFHVHQEVFRKSLIFPLSSFASYLESSIMPWAYRNVEFITISPSTKKDMEKTGIGKAGIHIVYPGVDSERMVPGEKNPVPLMVSLGRLKKYKSIDVFIKSIPYVLKKIRNARFVIAGDGEERKKLQSLVNRLEIGNVVQFTGKITQEAKIELYQKAWVFVNTSLMEGWAITNIEACSCGTPVVASNVPGMKDSVSPGESGFLVEYGNPEATAEKIIELIVNTSTRKQMEKKAVVWAKKFEWNKSAEKSLTIFGFS